MTRSKRVVMCFGQGLLRPRWKNATRVHRRHLPAAFEQFYPFPCTIRGFKKSLWKRFKMRKGYGVRKRPKNQGAWNLLSNPTSMEFWAAF